MLSIIDALNTVGICSVEQAYTSHEISALNAAVDRLMFTRNDLRRSYVYVDELQDLGMLDLVLGERMRRIMFSIMPDPVLHHCLIVESAGNDNQSNLFPTRMGGWHRGTDCSFNPGEPTHVSIFVYLTNVGEEDGAFEFAPQSPLRWLRSSTPSVLVTGPVGQTFAWQRSFFHRASPNRAPLRRRIVKLSIQRNAFRSENLNDPHFRRVIDALPSNDICRDILFGRYQGLDAPSVFPNSVVVAETIAATRRVELPDMMLFKAQAKMRAAEAKGTIGRLIRRNTITEPLPSTDQAAVGSMLNRVL